MVHIVSMCRTNKGLAVLHSDGVCEVKEGNTPTGFHTQYSGDYGRIACSSDGNVITVSNNESCNLTLWKRSHTDTTVFTPVLLEKGNDRYDSAVFNWRNSQVATVVGTDVLVLSVENGKTISLIHTEEPHYLHAVTFIGGASLLFGGERGVLYSYNAVSGKITTIHPFNTPIMGITIVGSNTILMFLGDGRVCKLFSKSWKDATATLDYTDRLSDFNDVLLQYGVSPDGKLLAVGCQDDYTVMVYDIATMAVVTSLFLPSKGLSAMVFDDDRTLLCAVNSNIMLYKLEGNGHV